MKQKGMSRRMSEYVDRNSMERRLARYTVEYPVNTGVTPKYRIKRRMAKWVARK